MKNYLLIFSLIIGISIPVFSQPSNGSIAPNIKLTDREGNYHNLYHYLDEGKVVFIKFFACHCPGCWAYHNTGKLETIYQTYGPSGTDQIMVLMLEHDRNNPDAFKGIGWNTQGDWEVGNSIPMIDVEGDDRSIFDDYNLRYYPMVLKVCSDKTVELMSTSYSIDRLYQEANDCKGTLSLNTVDQEETLFHDRINGQLILKGFNAIENFSVYNLMGQETIINPNVSSDIIDVSGLNSGLYLVKIEHANGVFKTKIIIE